MFSHWSSKKPTPSKEQQEIINHLTDAGNTELFELCWRTHRSVLVKHSTPSDVVNNLMAVFHSVSEMGIVGVYVDIEISTDPASHGTYTLYIFPDNGAAQHAPTTWTTWCVRTLLCGKKIPFYIRSSPKKLTSLEPVLKMFLTSRTSTALSDLGVSPNHEVYARVIRELLDNPELVKINPAQFYLNKISALIINVPELTQQQAIELARNADAAIASDIAARCGNIIAKRSAEQVAAKAEVTSLLRAFEVKLASSQDTTVSVTAYNFTVAHLPLLEKVIAEHCPKVTVESSIDETRDKNIPFSGLCNVTLTVTFE